MKGNRWQNFLTLPRKTVLETCISQGSVTEKTFRIGSAMASFKNICKILIIMEFDCYIELSKMKWIHMFMGQTIEHR